MINIGTVPLPWFYQISFLMRTSGPGYRSSLYVQCLENDSYREKDVTNWAPSGERIFHYCGQQQPKDRTAISSRRNCFLQFCESTINVNYLRSLTRFKESSPSPRMEEGHGRGPWKVEYHSAVPRYDGDASFDCTECLVSRWRRAGQLAATGRWLKM